MLTEISIFYSMFHILIIFIFLYEYRCSRRVFITATAAAISVMAMAEIWILLNYGLTAAGQAAIPVCSIPSFLLFFLMSKDRGARFVFTFCLADTVSIWILFFTGLADYFAGGGGIVIVISRIIAFPLLEYAIWKWFRKPFLEAIHTVQHGWWLFALITLVYYLIFVLSNTYPVVLWERPDAIPLGVLIAVLMPLAYFSIFAILQQQKEIHLFRERQDILQTQAAMMEQRAAETQQAEDKLRIERHDLRHRLNMVAALVEEKQEAEALNYIASAKDALTETEPRKYCRNTILDATLSVYLGRAEQMGIRTEIRLAFPDELPVDAAELSTVFANALENAISACGKLPQEERKICCTCTTEPRFMFEISNPCKDNVKFGSDGLPLAGKKGHGIGTRSIKAFAEKNNAICRFRMQNGWFRLQIVL